MKNVAELEDFQLTISLGKYSSHLERVKAFKERALDEVIKVLRDYKGWEMYQVILEQSVYPHYWYSLVLLNDENVPVCKFSLHLNYVKREVQAYKEWGEIS